jgi:hypothetical protein
MSEVGLWKLFDVDDLCGEKSNWQS